ncbi:MAG TPA: 5'-methylthioadenosine/S-adenosylhomocysteine nucleosidase [Kofleriaceae bacterium]|jgi:adenosylhomocysteine nucleosidase
MRALLLVLVGCAAAPRPVVAIISAHTEWSALIGDADPRAVHDTPFGPWLREKLGGRDVILFHGGYAKVSAAASAQYAIDRWHPSLIVNLGTAGGFGGSRHVGDIVLATDTIVYDILEQMGDPDEAIADYTTHLDVSRWPASLRSRVVLGPIVSGDRDLVPSELPRLAAKYHASAGDWESGAIAWVATRNHTPVLILRAITDLADAPGGDATYGNTSAWAAETKRAMAQLHALLASALPLL